MLNYKALKAASKVSVKKVGSELQAVKKSFHPDTGEALDDSVTVYSLADVKREIDYCKSQVTKLQSSQSEWEALETDLKAL